MCIRDSIKGHQEVQKMCRFIAEVQAEIGKPKFSFESKELDHDMFEAVKEYAIDRVKYALDTDDKDVYKRQEQKKPQEKPAEKQAHTEKKPEPKNCLLYTSRCV